jgi:hypothetical protein
MDDRRKTPNVQLPASNVERNGGGYAADMVRDMVRDKGRACP